MGVDATEAPMKLLLDTHVLLWWFDSEPHLSAAQRKALGAATEQEPLCVSDITLWEIATLLQLRRIGLKLPLQSWLEAATAPPLVRRCRITPTIAGELSSVPATIRDPADRLLVATARVLGATLVTQDRAIIASRAVPTLA